MVQGPELSRWHKSSCTCTLSMYDVPKLILQTSQNVVVDDDTLFTCVFAKYRQLAHLLPPIWFSLHWIAFPQSRQGRAHTLITSVELDTQVSCKLMTEQLRPINCWTAHATNTSQGVTKLRPPPQNLAGCQHIYAFKDSFWHHGELYIEWNSAHYFGGQLLPIAISRKVALGSFGAEQG